MTEASDSDFLQNLTQHFDVNLEQIFAKSAVSVIDHKPLFNLASVELASGSSRNQMISHLMNSNEAVFDYDNRKMTHFKIDAQVESVEDANS